MRKTLLVVVLLLMAVAAFAATPDSNSSNVTAAPGIKMYLMPDLTFHSVFTLDMLLQPAATLNGPPDGLTARPRHGTCRCSCGFPCATSADCGGSSCDPFITCCVGKPGSPETDWFTRSFEFSSHKTSQTDVILEQMVKSDCK
jgi:hypothetical protein